MFDVKKLINEVYADNGVCKELQKVIEILQKLGFDAILDDKFITAEKEGCGKYRFFKESRGKYQFPYWTYYYDADDKLTKISKKDLPGHIMKMSERVTESYLLN